jgi:FMN-dependent NADH-azoreductase
LQINSSIQGPRSASTELADAVAAQLGGRLTVRDLEAQPLPQLDGPTYGAFYTDPAERSQGQRDLVALSDQLVAELQQADTVILAVPMYNFGVPAAFKNWIDQVARVGVTFRYTENGPQGLLQNKRVVVVTSRGGQYRDSGADLLAPYLRQVLGFLGLDQLEFIYAEGLANPQRREQVLAQARADIAALAA